MSQWFGQYFGDSSPSGGGSNTDPGVGNVRFGISYTFSSVEQTGTLVLPSEEDVRSGIRYGTLGTEFEGSYTATCPACEGAATGDIEQLLGRIYAPLDVVDNDTLEAMALLWKTDTAALPALFKEQPGGGLVKSPRARPTELPYGTLACEATGKFQRYPSGTRKDVRKVTISMWGTKEQMVLALRAALGIFNSRMGAPGTPGLTYPSGARFIKWWPLDDGSLAQEADGKTKGGQDVWRAQITAEVTSVRSEV